MLRGRCSCAISGRPTCSPFAPPSLLHSITPLFPLHPRNSPVTPLFPLPTQKHGVGAVPPAKCPLIKRPSQPQFSVIPEPVVPAGKRSLLRTLNLQLSTLNCFPALTPIIPAHPRGSPVSPIIPAHTQKQGVGEVYCQLNYIHTQKLSARRHFRSRVQEIVCNCRSCAGTQEERAAQGARLRRQPLQNVQAILR